MKNRKRKKWRGLLLSMVLAVFVLLPGITSRAEGSLFDSPYVVPYYYFKDGEYEKYFTISQPQPIDYNRGETTYVYHSAKEYIKSNTSPSYWLPSGTTIETGIESSLRSPNVGEHYYDVNRTGEVPIGKWVVEHRPGWCIHDGNETNTWQGLAVGSSTCGGAYFSGWLCYCADCGRLLLSSLVYSPKDRIETSKMGSKIVVSSTGESFTKK